MKWEDLDYKTKGKLAKIYLDNGITLIDKMKEHYNSFTSDGHLYQDGGPDDDKYGFLRREPEVVAADNTRYVRPVDPIQLAEAKEEYKKEQLQKAISEAQKRQPQLKADTRSDKQRQSDYNRAVQQEVKQKANEQAAIYGRALGANHDMTVDEVNSNTLSTAELAGYTVAPYLMTALQSGYYLATDRPKEAAITAGLGFGLPIVGRAVAPTIKGVTNLARNWRFSVPKDASRYYRIVGKTGDPIGDAIESGVIRAGGANPKLMAPLTEGEVMDLSTAPLKPHDYPMFAKGEPWRGSTARAASDNGKPIIIRSKKDTDPIVWEESNKDFRHKGHSGIFRPSFYGDLNASPTQYFEWWEPKKFGYLRHDFPKYSIKRPVAPRYSSAYSDELFLQGQGLRRSLDGTPIAPTVDAHGITKGNELEQLESILNNGFDKNKTLYTAPLAVKAGSEGIGAGLGTASGTAYTDGMFILTSKPGKELISDGIDAVLINTADKEYALQVQKYLQQKYPNIKFMTYEEAPSYYGSKWNPIPEVQPNQNIVKPTNTVPYGSVGEELPSPPEEVNILFSSDPSPILPKKDLSHIQDWAKKLELEIILDGGKMRYPYYRPGKDYVERGVSPEVKEIVETQIKPRLLTEDTRFYLAERDPSYAKDFNDAIDKTANSVEVSEWSERMTEDYNRLSGRKIGGMSLLDKPRIIVNRDFRMPVSDVETHELRHQLQKTVPRTPTEEAILKEAYGDVPQPLKYDGSVDGSYDMSVEWETMNTEARKILLEEAGYKYDASKSLAENVVEQDKILESYNERNLIKILQNSADGYWRRFIDKLKLKSPEERSAKVAAWKKAMKIVGAYVPPVIGTGAATIQKNPPESDLN